MENMSGILQMSNIEPGTNFLHWDSFGAANRVSSVGQMHFPQRGRNDRLCGV